MIQYALHENQFLNVCKYYRQIFDTKSIKEDKAKSDNVLQSIILFVTLAPYDNEQSDLIHRIYEDSKDRVPLYR